MIRLSGATGWPVERIKTLPGCAAIAGVVDADIADRLKGALGLKNALVEEDRYAMVDGALGARDGALATDAAGAEDVAALSEAGVIVALGDTAADYDAARRYFAADDAGGASLQRHAAGSASRARALRGGPRNQGVVQA